MNKDRVSKFIKINTEFMYIQPGHGLNDFQEFQIRGKSKGGLISRFIFKGIY